MNMSREEFFETNRAGWDERVGLHLRDQKGIYRFEAFRAGEDILGPIESAELGDISGRRVLHLQCHFGMDTICLARRGGLVTGLDFSPEAVAAARTLAAEVGAEVRFVESNVYDAPAATGGGFDMVFTSWGAIGWLPDIEAWAKVVADCLVDGGSFYIAEAHPMLWMVEEIDGKIELVWDWRTPKDQPIKEDYAESYAGDGTPVRNSISYGWNHPLSDILGALAKAGMNVEWLHEHEMIPWQAFPSMVRKGTQFVQRDGQPKMPLAFSLRATKSVG